MGGCAEACKEICLPGDHSTEARCWPGGRKFDSDSQFFILFSFQVRAGKWEEAIRELNSATRFLESGDNVCSSVMSRRPRKLSWNKSCRSGWGMWMGGCKSERRHLCPWSHHRVPWGLQVKQSGKIMFWRSTRTKMLRLALSCLPTSLALQRLRVWQRSAQCWAAIGETAAVGKVAFLAFCLLLQCWAGAGLGQIWAGGSGGERGGKEKAACWSSKCHPQGREREESGKGNITNAHTNCPRAQPDGLRQVGSEGVRGRRQEIRRRHCWHQGRGGGQALIVLFETLKSSGGCRRDANRSRAHSQPPAIPLLHLSQTRHLRQLIPMKHFEYELVLSLSCWITRSIV